MWQVANYYKLPYAKLESDAQDSLDSPGFYDPCLQRGISDHLGLAAQPVLLFLLSCAFYSKTGEQFNGFVVFNTADFLVMERYEMVEGINASLAVSCLQIIIAVHN